MAEPDKPKRVSFADVPHRVRWLIYLSSFGTVGYGYLLVAISAYLPEIGKSPSEVGLLLGINGFSFVVSAIPIGILADRRGRKNIFLMGMLATTPILLVFAFTTDMLYLSLAALLAGTSEGAFMATWNALIADNTTLRNRNEAFSLSFIIGNASFGLGFALPFIFPSIETWFGLGSHSVHAGAFMVLALLSLLSPITMWRLLRGYVEEPSQKKTLLKKESRKTLYKFSGINSLIGLGAGFIIPLIPTWLWLKFGIEDTFSGPLLALSNVTIGLAAIISARLGQKYGMVRAIVLTQGLSTVFMLSLAYLPNPVIAGGVYMIRAALMNMASPLSDSFLMGIISKEDRGFASALNSLVWRLPNSASTLVGGVLLGTGRYDLPFLVATGFYVVAIVLFYSVFKDMKPTG